MKWGTGEVRDYDRGGVEETEWGEVDNTDEVGWVRLVSDGGWRGKLRLSAGDDRGWTCVRVCVCVCVCGGRARNLEWGRGPFRGN